jgi:hypothetical protein
MEFPKSRSEFNAWTEAKNKEVTDFRQKRSVLYPMIAEQLDALWKDINDGVIPGKGGKFHTSIKKVKEAVRKPDWHDEYIYYDFSKEEFVEDVPLTTLKRDDESILGYIREAEKFLAHEDKIISEYALKLTKNAHDLIANMITYPTFIGNVQKLNYLMYLDDVNSINYIYDQIVLIYNRPHK